MPGGTARDDGQQLGRLGADELGERRGAGGEERVGQAGALAGVVTGSLPALLDERLHEVLGVGLQHVVDLVEDRVDVLVELFLALGDGRVGLDLGSLVRFLGSLLRLLLLLVPCPDLSQSRLARERFEQLLGRVAAVDQRPTCPRLPRSGSMVGTRCSDSRPGRSKITESHDAAATLSPYFSRQRPRK